MRKWIIVFSLFMVGSLALTGCQAEQTVAAAQPTGASETPDSVPSFVVQGYVEPQHFVDLAFSTAGQVEEVLVGEGDLVSQGQVIARLAGSQPRQAEVAQAKQELLDAQQAQDELNRQAKLNYAQALQSLSTAIEDLDDARIKADRLGNTRGNTEQIASAQANYILAKEKFDKLKSVYNNKSALSEDDPERALALANMENARKEMDKALINLNWYKGSPDDVEQAQVEADLAAAQATYDLAVDTVTRLKDGPDPDDLAAAKARIDSAQASLNSAQYSLDTLELRAAEDGTIVDLNLKVGQYVQAGATAVSLADYTGWVIKTDDLTELEVVDVYPGQAVEVIFDAIPNQTLSGTVDSIASRYEEKRGDRTYTVTVDLTQSYEMVRWGMTSQVIFQTVP